MLQKLSKCEVKAAQRGFYHLPATQILVNLVNSNGQKVSFLALLEIPNFDFRKFEPFLKSQIYQSSKLRVSEIVKMAIFKIHILPKLFSRKIEWQIDKQFFCGP